MATNVPKVIYHAVEPAVNTTVEVFTVPTDSLLFTLAVDVFNRNATAVESIQVWIVPPGSALPADNHLIICTGMPIDAFGTLSKEGYAIPPGAKVFIRSGNAKVNFIVNGVYHPED